MAEPPFTALVRKVPSRAGFGARPGANRGKEFPHAFTFSVGPESLRAGAGGPRRTRLAAPDDGQPAATAQPAIGLETSPSAQPSTANPPSLTYDSPTGGQTSGGYQPLTGLMPSYGPEPSSAPRAADHPPAPAKHHHKGLFGWRHCVECQRARVKAHDGIDIPPPPSPPGMVYQGQVIVTGPMVMNDPHGMVVNGSQEAGYAVVGPGAEDTTGYAVVGGPAPSAEPTPIGVARGGQNPSWADARMAAMAPRRVQGRTIPRSSPPACRRLSSAIAGPGHDRPHIISHILGIPLIGTHRRQREQRERENHAAIAYGDSKQKVTELPASMVYGKDTSR